MAEKRHQPWRTWRTCKPSSFYSLWIERRIELCEIPWSKSPQSWKEFFFGRGILSLSLSRSNKEVFVLVCTEASIERSSMTFQDPPAVNILKFMRRIYVRFFSSLVFLSFFFFPRLYNSIAGRASVTVSIATMKWIKIRQGIVASNDLECETRRSI